MFITQIELQKLPIKIDMNIGELKIGDRFLSKGLGEQQSNKKIGDLITVYQITDIRPNGNIVYIAKYFTLK